jgi:hypothetical protein
MSAQELPPHGLSCTSALPCWLAAQPGLPPHMFFAWPAGELDFPVTIAVATDIELAWSILDDPELVLLMCWSVPGLMPPPPAGLCVPSSANSIVPSAIKFLFFQLPYNSTYICAFCNMCFLPIVSGKHPYCKKLTRFCYSLQGPEKSNDYFATQYWPMKK